MKGNAQVYRAQQGASGLHRLQLKEIPPPRSPAKQQCLFLANLRPQRTFSRSPHFASARAQTID